MASWILVALAVPPAFAACSSDDGPAATTSSDAGAFGAPAPIDAAIFDYDAGPPFPEAGPGPYVPPFETPDASADAGPPAIPTSTDGFQDGTETDVDCGGGAPTNAAPCAITKQCIVDTDCAVGTCEPTAKRCATAGHLYASYYATNMAVGYASASTLGTTTESPTTTLAANGASGVAIDSVHDILYATSLTDGTILVRTTGSTSNAAPTHTLTGIAKPVGLAVDGAADRLFVAGYDDGTVYVFDQASTLDGAVTATRTITAFGTTAYPFGLAYDAVHDRLFVSSSGSSHVDVFDSASTANGTRAATVSRSIDRSPTAIDTPHQLAYDPSHDELYVASAYDFKSDGVVVFGNASTANGPTASTRAFGFSGLSINGIALDLSRDEIYVSSSNTFAILVVPSAHTANGAILESSLRSFTGLQDFPTQLAFDPGHP